VTDGETGQKACVTGCCLKKTTINPGPPLIERNDCYMSTEIFCTENQPGTTFRANDNSCTNTDAASGCDNIVNKLPLP
jgi:hypothetical protein